MNAERIGRVWTALAALACAGLALSQGVALAGGPGAFAVAAGAVAALVLWRSGRSRRRDRTSEDSSLAPYDAVLTRAGLAPRPQLLRQSDRGVGATAEISADGAAIRLTSGLLSRSPPEEVEAVIAHECAHLAAGDMRLAAIARGAAALALAVGLLGMAFIPFLLALDPRGAGAGAWLVGAAVLAQALARLNDRRREFAADAFAARLVGAGPVIAALDRRAALEAEVRGRGGWAVRLAALDPAQPSPARRRAALANLS